MILKQFRQYTIDGVNYTSLADIQKSLNLTMMQISWRRKKDPNWLVVVKGPVGVRSPKKEYYICDGVKYLTMVEAALAHGITKEAVRQRVNGWKWDWFKVVAGVQQPKPIKAQRKYQQWLIRQQPKPKPIKAQRILDQTTYYYRKKMGIPTPRIVPKTYKKKPKVLNPPIPRPKKYKPRVKTMTPYNFNRINNLQKPKEIREILDEMFAKKEAKKHKK